MLQKTIVAASIFFLASCGVSYKKPTVDEEVVSTLPKRLAIQYLNNISEKHSVKGFGNSYVRCVFEEQYYTGSSASQVRKFERNAKRNFADGFEFKVYQIHGKNEVFITETSWLPIQIIDAGCVLNNFPSSDLTPIVEALKTLGANEK